MITVKVSDLLAKAQEISDRGLKFVEVTEFDEAGTEGNPSEKWLHFEAFDVYSMVDFEDIEEATPDN